MWCSKLCWVPDVTEFTNLLLTCRLVTCEAVLFVHICGRRLVEIPRACMAQQSLLYPEHAVHPDCSHAISSDRLQVSLMQAVSCLASMATYTR